jgi:lysylphosphatidylglycerol synthetase-like protein (DUF2156 family)
VGTAWAFSWKNLGLLSEIISRIELVISPFSALTEPKIDQTGQIQDVMIGIMREWYAFQIE